MVKGNKEHRNSNTWKGHYDFSSLTLQSAELHSFGIACYKYISLGTYTRSNILFILDSPCISIK